MPDSSSVSMTALARGMGSLLCLFPPSDMAERPIGKVHSKSAWVLYADSYNSIGNYFDVGMAEMSARVTQEQRDRLKRKLSEILAETEPQAKKIGEVQDKRSEGIIRNFGEAAKAQTLRMRAVRELFS